MKKKNVRGVPDMLDNLVEPDRVFSARTGRVLFVGTWLSVVHHLLPRSGVAAVVVVGVGRMDGVVVGNAGGGKRRELTAAEPRPRKHRESQNSRAYDTEHNLIQITRRGKRREIPH